MSTISSIMNTAISALQTQQAGIDVTSTNIANANTDGYSRREIVIETKAVCSMSYAMLGSGVEASEVKRIYDEFLMRRLVSENEDLGKFDVECRYYETLETVFTDSADHGLNEAMSEFWNCWQDVTNDPPDSTARSVLASQAETLANTFNNITSDLDRIQKDIDNDVELTVDEINRMVREIAGLNRKILQAEASGQTTNTYEDSLDSLVLELATLVDTTTYENDDDRICIQLANGRPLVDGAATWPLSTETSTSTGLKDVTWVDGNGDPSVISGDISGGELGGMLEVRDEVIPDYREKLDDLASSIMEEVNALHTTGYDLYGDSGDSLFCRNRRCGHGGPCGNP